MHRIKESNMENPVNVLKVREMERWSQMVSWSDDPGKWYIQVKDGKELEAFSRRMAAR
jgi:[histone H3]-lysine79 N-trimethyltransferase